MVDSVARPKRITIVTPAVRGSASGNRVTALRWAGLLRQLGHRVRIISQWRNVPTDLLIAVHAVKTADAVLAASQDQPGIRVVTLLAGTDIYPDFSLSAKTLAAMQRADALIALQPRALDVLPAELIGKARTMVQSATAVETTRSQTFTATVLAHLRPVKQPLLAIEAVAKLDAKLPVQLLLAGAKLDDAYGKQVEAAIATTPQATWLGPLTRHASKQLLASSHLCIVPSSSEGGANVVSEAIAAGTAILCSAIPGNLGLLGDDWPGAFPVGDAEQLARLISRAATDRVFFDELCLRTRQLQAMVSPATECEAWRVLIRDLYSCK